jgi:hypothetical protein
MAKRIVAALGAVLLSALAAVAQQTKPGRSGDSTEASKKLVTISGQVGQDGKTFVSAKDQSVWKVMNPEILLDNVGGRVSIRAQVDSLKHEILVMTVQIDPTVGARLRDTAFRR